MEYLLIIAVVRLKGRALTKVVTNIVPGTQIKNPKDLAGAIEGFEILLNCSSRVYFEAGEQTEKIISMAATPVML